MDKCKALNQTRPDMEKLVRLAHHAYEIGKGTCILSENECEQSIKYVVPEKNVHCITLGFESDDAMEHVMHNVKKLIRL